MKRKKKHQKLIDDYDTKNVNILKNLLQKVGER